MPELHDRPLAIDLIELTLNHGLFVVRAAGSLAEAEALFAPWHPHTAGVDMDSVIHLSGIEQSLLYLLVSRAGRSVSREDILDAIWETDFVAKSNIVDRHIQSLRIKLQNDYRHPRFIATIPGAGVSLRADLLQFWLG